MKAIFATLLAALCVLGSANAAQAAGSSSISATGQRSGDLPAYAAIAAGRIVADGVPDITILAARQHERVVSADVGTRNPDKPIPIASASKWLTAAVVMALVDDGTLSLDAPVSTWLADLPPVAGALTLRQLLSQTSGLGQAGLDLGQDYRMTLAESAKAIASAPLAHPPGSTFVYGGPGFQVAGAVVEAASGKSWETVFQERIARPLEMTHTYWTHILLRDAADPHRDDVRNPTLQGGAISTADDYMHFLEMLAAGGSYGSRRVLSAEAVDTLLSDQTAEATRTPTGVELIDSAHYAIGNWCETWEGRRCIRNSSLGAWGVYPWIDRTANLYGIVFLFEKDNAFRLLPHIRGIVDGIVSAHPPG